MSNKRSNSRGPAVETTASFPNPAQDYYEGPISLDRHLVRRPTSTFVLRVTSDALASQGIRQGDEILVDRSLAPLPGRVLVVVVDNEHRLGTFELRDGAAVLITDLEEIPLTSEVEPWGVATVLIHHLPLGQLGESTARRAAG
ncbi:LexA family protein [Nocardioides sp. Bht2]|uniref:LexA family protein n=1 Tax=Nocardioides sp. Bht2 TaxID=3392297 RepID=UPI0039B59859